MRKMSLGKNDQGQDMIVDFYQKTAFSTWVLATGNVSYNYFNNVESASLRNYNKGQNFFEQNQGRVLALQMELLDTAGSSVTWTPTLATAWGTLRNAVQLVTSQDSTISDLCLGSDIAPPPPVVIGASVAVANFDGGSALVRPSSKRAKYFEPPLFVANGRSIDIIATVIGTSVPSALNGYYLRLYATLEEMPQTNVNAVRQ